MIYSRDINGNIHLTKDMPAIVSNETGSIYFVRDDNGVTAWFCNNIQVTDWNAHKITDVNHG